MFAGLAEGASAGITVVTPNRRLATAFAEQFDASQWAHGQLYWESADVLPVNAFVERLYQEALYSDAVASLPLLLKPAQELLLWERVIEASEWGSVLLSPGRTAEEVRKAWNLAHQWGIAGALGQFAGNEDAVAFAQWAQEYRRRTEQDRYTDAARLPDLAAGLLHNAGMRRPKLLVVYAFNTLPPQTRSLFEACVRAGTELRSAEPERRDAEVLRWVFPAARDELDCAAKWARTRLEQFVADSPMRAPRIAIVVPDLERRRKEVVRVMSRTLCPDFKLASANVASMHPARAYNVSIGVPLADYPLVHAALGLIELAGGAVDFPLGSRLLRSPFVAGARAEGMSRARLDAILRKVLAPRLTLPRLLSAIGGTSALVPLLFQHLNAMLEYAQANFPGRKPAQDWADHFSSVLKAVGFPGDRGLDSTEYQTHAKWNEVLAEFSGLARVASPMGFREALSRLRRLCAAALFQPESGAEPIQVLGVLESAGMEFDHLWVCGMTDEAWPLAARPSAFIPPMLQRKAGIPEASTESALELDSRITREWMTSASEVVLSHALREDDRQVSPSPLIVDVPEGRLELPHFPAWRDVLHAARRLERLPDGFAPVVEAGPVRGGSRVLADQSACPFRAFAAHRLSARSLELPVAGLDAAARGNLLHWLMKGIWDELKTQAALMATPDSELAAIIDHAAAAAVAKACREISIEDRFAELERGRLAKLAREWLDVERSRKPFEVVASEEARPLVAGGLVLSGRIDRIDRLEDGSCVLIDYKTGRATPRHWEGARPEDPQLPLYAVNATEDISAVAFAKLKTGGMRMMGYSRDKNALPKVMQYHDWPGLLGEWKQEMDSLAAAFTAGDARVDPKNLAQTCRYCDLQPLCRVHERFSALALDEEGTDGEAVAEGEDE